MNNIESIYNCTNIQQLDDFVLNLDFRIGFFGGRRFVHYKNKNDSYSLNDIIRKLGKILEDSKNKQLASSVINKIRVLDKKANIELSKRNIIIRILTVVRSWFGCHTTFSSLFKGPNFDREKILKSFELKISKSYKIESKIGDSPLEDLPEEMKGIISGFLRGEDEVTTVQLSSQWKSVVHNRRKNEVIQGLKYFKKTIEVLREKYPEEVKECKSIIAKYPLKELIGIKFEKRLIRINEELLEISKKIKVKDLILLKAKRESFQDTEKNYISDLLDSHREIKFLESKTRLGGHDALLGVDSMLKNLIKKGFVKKVFELSQGDERFLSLVFKLFRSFKDYDNALKAAKMIYAFKGRELYFIDLVYDFLLIGDNQKVLEIAKMHPNEHVVVENCKIYQTCLQYLEQEKIFDAIVNIILIKNRSDYNFESNLFVKKIRGNLLGKILLAFHKNGYSKFITRSFNEEYKYFLSSDVLSLLEYDTALPFYWIPSKLGKTEVIDYDLEKIFLRLLEKKCELEEVAILAKELNVKEYGMLIKKIVEILDEKGFHKEAHELLFPSEKKQELKKLEWKKVSS